MSKRLIIFLFLFFIIFFQPIVQSAADDIVILVEVDGTIDESTVEILQDSLQMADANSAEAIILLLSTPGGGLDQTFRIADLIANSTIPVVGYVYPTGAAAWSAGSFILMSTHIAAMADFSVIGSCQPVQITATGTELINDTKTINALVSWMQERANKYDRNATLAKEFITVNRNVNASKALQLGVIEYVSDDVERLLQQINGEKVQTSKGNVTLSVANATLKKYTPPIQIQLLKFISNPLLTSTLLMIGIFALIFGISAPGFGAEVFGVLAIVLSLAGSGFAISEISILFLILGGILLLLELFVIPGFGVVGIGGVISLFIGAVFLVPTYATRQWVINTAWIDTIIIILLVLVGLFAGFFIFLLYKILAIRKKREAIGLFSGETAEAVDTIGPNNSGYVRYKGELWNAKSESFIPSGTKVKIDKKDGSTLYIYPAEKDEKTDTKH
ncbi:MAG: nodulation protein NfeD [Candidatus Thermoplasmatota archaeon]|nr:nodulation protein NfeD [Candidatus Thermoplasmatota archaeon]